MIKEKNYNNFNFCNNKLYINIIYKIKVDGIIINYFISLLLLLLINFLFYLHNLTK